MEEKKIKLISKPGIAEAIHPEIGNGSALASNVHEFLLRYPDPLKSLDDYFPKADTQAIEEGIGLATITPSQQDDSREPVSLLESTISNTTQDTDHELISLSDGVQEINKTIETSESSAEGEVPKPGKKPKVKKSAKPDPIHSTDLSDDMQIEDKGIKAGKLVRKAAKSVKRQEDDKLKAEFSEQVTMETTLSPYTKWLKSLAGSEYVHPYEEDFALAQGSGTAGEGISETFADLLAIQGYKEQAIEMYIKLMEKYPEKSGFFAAKIEALQ